jgi:hypothetical protein
MVSVNVACCGHSFPQGLRHDRWDSFGGARIEGLSVDFGEGSFINRQVGIIQHESGTIMLLDISEYVEDLLQVAHSGGCQEVRQSGDIG